MITKLSHNLFFMFNSIFFKFFTFSFENYSKTIIRRIIVNSCSKTDRPVFLGRRAKLYTTLAPANDKSILRVTREGMTVQSANRELKHRRPWATNSNRKLTVPFVRLFLLLVLEWKTLVLMSACHYRCGGVKTRQKKKINFPYGAAVRGSRTSMLKDGASYC